MKSEFTPLMVYEFSCLGRPFTVKVVARGGGKLSVAPTKDDGSDGAPVTWCRHGHDYFPDEGYYYEEAKLETALRARLIEIGPDILKIHRGTEDLIGLARKRGTQRAWRFMHGAQKKLLEYYKQMRRGRDQSNLD